MQLAIQKLAIGNLVAFKKLAKVRLPNLQNSPFFFQNSYDFRLVLEVERSPSLPRGGRKRSNSMELTCEELRITKN